MVLYMVIRKACFVNTVLPDHVMSSVWFKRYESVDTSAPWEVQ